MQLLGNTEETFVPPSEICNPGKKLVNLLYNMTDYVEATKHGKVRGIKCPSHARDEIGLIFSEIYPGVKKLIIGVRHPVKWFESFYNFRANNSNGKYPPAESKIGSGGGPKDVTTHRARFHDMLAQLGKTALTSKDEIQLLRDDFQFKTVTYSPVQVFLYDVNQLYASDIESTFLKPLQQFLGLKLSLPKPPHVTPGKNITGELLRRVEKLKIDICDSRYDELRGVLVENGRQAQQWIIDYFLNSTDVFVPSQQSFEESLRRWATDPCLENDYLGRRTGLYVKELNS